jgi:hypothetical protein
MLAQLIHAVVATLRYPVMMEYRGVNLVYILVRRAISFLFRRVPMLLYCACRTI